MEPPASLTFSCALTRDAETTTLVLTASPDGKDNPSTTRRIEIVARDSGNPNAHRAHHPTISTATWTRCLDESFDGGNEIVPAENTPTKAAWNRFLNEHPKGGNEPVSDEDTPLLLGLIRMSFEEGGDSDENVAQAFVRRVHENFTIPDRPPPALYGAPPPPPEPPPVGGRRSRKQRHPRRHPRHGGPTARQRALHDSRRGLNVSVAGASAAGASVSAAAGSSAAAAAAGPTALSVVRPPATAAVTADGQRPGEVEPMRQAERRGKQGSDPRWERRLSSGRLARLPEQLLRAQLQGPRTNAASAAGAAGRMAAGAAAAATFAGHLASKALQELDYELWRREREHADALADWEWEKYCAETARRVEAEAEQRKPADQRSPLTPELREALRQAESTEATLTGSCRDEAQVWDSQPRWQEEDSDELGASGFPGDGAGFFPGDSSYVDQDLLERAAGLQDPPARRCTQCDSPEGECECMWGLRQDGHCGAQVRVRSSSEERRSADRCERGYHIKTRRRAGGHLSQLQWTSFLLHRYGKVACSVCTYLKASHSTMCTDPCELYDEDALEDEAEDWVKWLVPDRLPRKKALREIKKIFQDVDRSTLSQKIVRRQLEKAVGFSKRELDQVKEEIKGLVYDALDALEQEQESESEQEGASPPASRPAMGSMHTPVQQARQRRDGKGLSPANLSLPQPVRRDSAQLKWRQMYGQASAAALRCGRGHLIMERWGWRPGAGLGREGQGRKTPVTAHKRTARAGLGLAHPWERHLQEEQRGAAKWRRSRSQMATASAAAAALSASLEVEEGLNQLAEVITDCIAAKHLAAAAVVAGRQRMCGRLDKQWCGRLQWRRQRRPLGRLRQSSNDGVAEPRHRVRCQADARRRAEARRWASRGACVAVIEIRYRPRPKEASSVVVNLTTREKLSRGF